MGVKFQPLVKSGLTLEKASGSGDITGPASSTANNIPQFSDNTGKVLKDGLGLVTTVGSPGSDTNIPSEKAVRSAISGAGGGDVSGPASSIENNIVVFDDTSGKLIQDGGENINNLKILSIAYSVAL